MSAPTRTNIARIGDGDYRINIELQTGADGEVICGLSLMQRLSHPDDGLRHVFGLGMNAVEDVRRTAQALVDCAERMEALQQQGGQS